MDDPRAIPGLAFAAFGVALSLAGQPVFGLMCSVAALLISWPDEARR